MPATMNTLAEVLLVEDDEALGELTIEVLALFGHPSALATTVPEAYRLLAVPHSFRVVLLDLQIAEDRGEHLIERLERAGARLPAVVILSAQPLSELARAGQRVHAAAILQKPCSMQELTETIERIAA